MTDLNKLSPAAISMEPQTGATTIRALVIGEGMLGCALIDALSEAGHHVIGTSRDVLSDKFYLNLIKEIPTNLPKTDVTYIVAALANYKACERDQDSWQINADSPVEIARRVTEEENSFPVFVSSDVVEWMSGAYARQKSYAELGVLMFGGAVVRPSKFTADNVSSLCHLMIRVGLDRKPGVYRWP